MSTRLAKSKAESARGAIQTPRAFTTKNTKDTKISHQEEEKTKGQNKIPTGTSVGSKLEKIKTAKEKDPNYVRLENLVKDLTEKLIATEKNAKKDSAVLPLLRVLPLTATFPAAGNTME